MLKTRGPALRLLKLHVSLGAANGGEVGDVLDLSASLPVALGPSDLGVIFKNLISMLVMIF